MPEFNEDRDRRPSDEDLLAIRRMRRFRRALSIIAALLVLLAAVLLALTTGRSDNVQMGPAARGNGPAPFASGCDVSTSFVIPVKLNV